MDVPDSYIIDKGQVKKPYYINFVLGMAYQCAVKATPQKLITPVGLLPPLPGGMARIGMEDNVYYRRGVLAKNNAELVRRTVNIVKELGFEIAFADDARKILGLEKEILAK